jgi:protein-S-isoprenylcysteine O-methyltransferase Ste14
LLLVRSRWAVAAFVLSLLGLIGSHIYQYSSNAPASMNTSSGTIFAGVLAIVALALLWYAMRLRKQGILR